MNADIWTLVPMRGIERGKSRLAAVLGDAGRMRLNRWLLIRTLKVIEHWRGNLQRCVVISPCDQTLTLARCAGAQALRETPETSDLNRALALGAAYATANEAGKLLVLPCDLPHLTASSLAMLAAAGGRPQHMGIVPDAARAGTNALLVDAHPQFEFGFGASSFTRHRQRGSARGWRTAVCPLPELVFDLDTPQDLAAWNAPDFVLRDAKITHGIRCPRTDGKGSPSRDDVPA